MEAMGAYRIIRANVTFYETRLGITVSKGFVVINLSGLRLWLPPQEQA
jgi:hypothetical protein